VSPASAGSPYVLERMDTKHDKYGPLVEDVRLPLPPSEYVRRQV